MIGLMAGLGLFASLSASDDVVDQDKVLQARESVVIIEGDKIDETSPGGRSNGISYNGVGSGIIIDSRGYIITNYHVIDGIRKIQVKTFDGTKYQGYYVSHDPVTDIALIKITPNQPLVPICIGTSSTIRELDTVVVIGNPFGYPYSVNRGEISGLNRYVKVTDDLKYNNMIQLSAAINPGNSGGPLLNTGGEVIGINAALRQGATGIAFAIPIDLVMEVGEQLISQHTSQFCYHGIRFKQKNKDSFYTDSSHHTASKEQESVLVDAVEPGSPAEEAGIKPGDAILSANDTNVARKIDFQKALIDLHENDKLELVIERDHEKYDATFALRHAKNNNNRVASAAPQVTSQFDSSNNQVKSTANAVPVNRGTSSETMMANRIMEVFGVRVRPVSQEEFLQMNPRLTANKYDYEGAMQVTTIRKDGLWYQYGIREGDLIAGVISGAGQNSWSITKMNDLKFIADKWSPDEMGNEVIILYVRGQVDSTIRIPVRASLAQSAQKSSR